MKKLMLMCFAVALIMSVSAFGQDTMKRDDMKTDNAKSEKMSAKAVHIVGKVGDDGKTFVSNKDGKTWKVSNPDALKGHEGYEVSVRAHVDADKDEIHVTSVKMLKNEMKEKMK
jgi:pentapeptide MXKDX repeat protein